MAKLAFQQGRLTTDADLNTQSAVLLHQLRAVVGDFAWPHGGPRAAAGFGVTPMPPSGSDTLPDLAITPGRYYVDGILCEAEDDGPLTYWRQPHGFRDPRHSGDRLPQTGGYFVYLRVWERLVTASQQPALRDPALGVAAPDTSARVQTVWQVLATTAPVVGGPNPTTADLRRAFTEWAEKTERLAPENRPTLAAAGCSTASPQPATSTSPATAAVHPAPRARRLTSRHRYRN
ncbi:hypothetical protein FB570_11125 [Streptomyces sp. T12]|uniref:DUF6519 domain-containing protein n=1 Tax=Streptomyces sp. T12 TaxID=477697 RepID=UPI0011ACE9B1|nr:DUF6519 domain-containing protein [Streptomyces sp. T12]TWD17412.1 hypothetical protein FB570_11125 [Streptomyces sp. T12]